MLVALFVAQAYLLSNSYATDGDVPLTKPDVVIEILPAADDVKWVISRENALDLATTYSGFALDETVTIRRVMYADKAHPRGKEEPLFPWNEPTPAWLVSFPNASIESTRADGKPEEVLCPVHVGIHGESGTFLGAFGDSTEKWAEGGPTASSSWSEWAFSEPEALPKRTVKAVLETYHCRPSETGQFFVRYLRVTAEYPKAVVRRADSAADRISMMPPFDGWLFSQRGAILRGGFSTPPGYDGPELYATCSDFLLSDRSGKLITGIRYR